MENSEKVHKTYSSLVWGALPIKSRITTNTDLLILVELAACPILIGLALLYLLLPYINWISTSISPIALY